MVIRWLITTPTLLPGPNEFGKVDNDPVKPPGAPSGCCRATATSALRSRCGSYTRSAAQKTPIQLKKKKKY